MEPTAVVDAQLSVVEQTSRLGFLPGVTIRKVTELKQEWTALPAIK